MAFSTIVDSLYCQEEQLDLLDYQQDNQEADRATPASLAEEQRETNLYLLCSLCQKESETNPEAQTLSSLGYLLSGARRDMVTWVVRAVSVHGFTTQTALLSVNYLDRCFLSGVFKLQPDKPWMGRLAAVACLSLAAKVEETRVPLLIDLQLPGTSWEEVTGTDTGNNTGFLFEAKTVRRMELLVLSALKWRLNSVTALSFIQPLISLLSSEKRGVYLTSLCEGLLLSALDDWRWMKYAPSVWATAALFHALEEFDETQRLMSLIKVSKEKAQECYDLIQERMMAANNLNLNRKRKRKHSICKISSDHQSPPGSPSAVINACFSCENSSSSNDLLRSWPSSTTSSPDQPAKRTHYVSIANYNDSLLRDEESRQAWQL